MDENKNRYSFLERLPPDVWASITPCLYGEHLARLKFTGSKILWSRLCAKNVVKTLIIGKDFINFTKRFKLLKDLSSVTEFEIQCLSDRKWENWEPTVALLPSTLRSLKLRVAQEFCQSFFEGANLSGPNWGYQVPLLESLDVRDDWSSSTSWPCHTPSNLTYLKVCSFEGYHPLPPSLVHLHTLVYDVEVDDFKLPETLETFTSEHVANNISICKIVSRLPQLRTFDIGDYMGISLESILTSLPQTATHLGRLSVQSAETFSNLATAFMRLSYLTHLELRGLRPEFWSLLPPTLTTLDLNKTPKMEHIAESPNRGWPCSYPIHCIPKSVTRLGISFEVANDKKTALFETSDYAALASVHSGQMHMFPPNLSHFYLTNAQLTGVIASFLPASLVSLTVSYLDEHICERLPKRLIELRSYHTKPSSNLFKYLPKSLRYLNLGFESDVWIETENGMARNHDVKLEVDWNRSDCRLPPNLLHLCLLGRCGIDKSFAKQSLKSLQFLGLTGCDLPDEVVPFLSRHLTCLALSSSKITGKCFHALPNNLKWLSLSSAREINDSDIQHLPPSLIAASFPIAMLLTEACLKYLPKKLEGLDLSNNRNFATTTCSQLPKLLASHQGRGSFHVHHWCSWNGSLQKN